MRSLLILFSLLLPAQARAAKAVMEGIAATKQTVFVDTAAGRVDVSTASYGGGVSDVGLFVSSNAVVSDDGTNHVVIYATGSVMVNGTQLSTSTATGDAVKAANETISGNWTHTGKFAAQAASTFTSTVWFGSTLTFAANLRYSTTTIPATTMSGAQFGICVATVNITTNGGPVQVWFSGGVYVETAAGIGMVSFLADGEYAPGTTATIGMATGQSSSGTDMQDINYTKTIRPAAGTHNYCLTQRLHTAGYAVTLCHASWWSSCEFGAAEMQ